jgi:hypothetical protein
MVSHLKLIVGWFLVAGPWLCQDHLLLLLLLNANGLGATPCRS